MRSLLVLLIGCSAGNVKFGDSLLLESAGPESAPPESVPPESTPPDSSTDTAEEGCTTGVRLVQSVTYPEGADPYDLAATPEGFAVSFPADGEVGTGLVEGWTLDQGAKINREEVEPAYTVVGPGERQHLGVQMWANGEDLCSQVYGADGAGKLFCWPWDAEGEVSTVSTTAVEGLTALGYYGYGYADHTGIKLASRVWDAFPPGQVTDKEGSPLWTGACEDLEWCQSGAQIGDVVATVSEDRGFVFGHDATTGDLLWETSTEGTDLAATFAWSVHDIAFLVSSPSSSDGLLTVVIDPNTGIISWNSSDFTAGYAEGEASVTGQAIEVVAYYNVKIDGSQGGVEIWDRNNNYLDVSIAHLLDLKEPRDFDEAYIRLAALEDHPGYYAFLTRRGRYAGVLEVCGVPEEQKGARVRKGALRPYLLSPRPE